MRQFVRAASAKFVSTNVALLRMAPLRSALLRMALLRMAPLRLALLRSALLRMALLRMAPHYSCTYYPSNKESQNSKELHEHLPVYVTCLRKTKEPQASPRAGEDHEASPAYHPTWISDDPQRSLRLGTSAHAFA